MDGKDRESDRSHGLENACAQLEHTGCDRVDVATPSTMPRTACLLGALAHGLDNEGGEGERRDHLDEPLTDRVHVTRGEQSAVDEGARERRVDRDGGDPVRVSSRVRMFLVRAF